MSNYKRATLEEEEVSDAPAEAASSPDRVEVSECSKHTNTQTGITRSLYRKERLREDTDPAKLRTTEIDSLMANWSQVES